MLFRLILLIPSRRRATADPAEKQDPANDLRCRRSGKLEKRLASTRRIEK